MNYPQRQLRPRPHQIRKDAGSDVLQRAGSSVEEPGFSAYPRSGVRSRALPSKSLRPAFTLLELIFALAMVAIIVPVLVGMTTGAFRLKAASEAAVEPARTAEQAFDLLRQDLGDALPPSIQPVTLAGDFEGIQAADDRGYEADDLKFFTVADSPQHSPLNSEMRYVELTVITAPNGDHVLVRKVLRDMVTDQTSTTGTTGTTGSTSSGSGPIAPEPLDGTQVDPDVEVICRGVAGFKLEYYNGSPTPVNSWDSTAQDNTLPNAVAVTITLNRPNGNMRNEKDGQPCYTFTRIIPMPCSTAAFDSNVNPGNIQ